MIIKSWVWNQLIAEPDVEWNRIEQNINDIYDIIGHVTWPALTHKTDRDNTHVFGWDELNNIESNLELLADTYYFGYNRKTWSANDVIGVTDINRWEQFIDFMWQRASNWNLEYCGTFRSGEAGLI